MASLDLFNEDQKEFYEERSAIREFEGGQSRESAEAAALEETREWMFRCEVVSVCRMRSEKGLDAARSFLLKVEEKRGTEAANRLRSAANEAWDAGERGVTE